MTFGRPIQQQLDIQTIRRQSVQIRYLETFQTLVVKRIYIGFYRFHPLSAGKLYYLKKTSSTYVAILQILRYGQ